jgi:hypothetical protein
MYEIRAKLTSSTSTIASLKETNFFDKERFIT